MKGILSPGCFDQVTGNMGTLILRKFIEPSIMICVLLCLIILQLYKKSACGQQEILRSRTESHNDNANICVNFFTEP